MTRCDAGRETGWRGWGILRHPSRLTAGRGEWVWETDANARYVASSDAAERLLSRPLSAVLGRRVDEVLLASDVGTQSLLDAHTRPRALLVLRNEIVDATGTSRPLETICFPLLDGDGRFSGYHGVHRDRAAASSFVDGLPGGTEPGTLVYRKAPIPAYVWRRVGDEFHLTECNEAARAITRGGIERYLGSTAGAMYPDRPQVVAFLERCW